MEDHFDFSEWHSLIPRYDERGRVLPPWLYERILDRMNSENAGRRRTLEICKEEIGRWRAGGAEQNP